ncbi:UNVERIFIED_ORG: hypothetical protein ABIC97_005559 [Peribacillus simplex]
MGISMVGTIILGISLIILILILITDSNKKKIEKNHLID